MVVNEAIKPILSIGKMRGLQQSSTSSGTFVILALDHRNNLRTALRPEAPEAVTWHEMADFKCEVVSALAPVASSVLLDPETGLAQCIVSGALPGKTGLIEALEAAGYSVTL